MKRYIKKGFTLTEILLFLGLAAIIIAIIFITYKKVSSSSKINREANIVTNIVSAVDKISATTSDYEFLRNGTFIANSHILPDESIINPDESDSYFYNSWGGPSNISISNYGPGNAKVYSTSYTIVETGVPADACPKFVAAVAGTAKLINVGTLSSGGWVLNKNDTDNQTLNIESLAKYCNSNNGDVVNIQLIYF